MSDDKTRLKRLLDEVKARLPKGAEPTAALLMVFAESESVRISIQMAAFVVADAKAGGRGFATLQEIMRVTYQELVDS